MSVVACKVENGKIYISSDSISVRGYTQSKGGRDSNSKLCKISEDFILGYVGSAQDGVLMQMYAETKVPAGNKDLDMVNYISEFQSWKKAKTEDSEIGCTYIIIYKGVPWYIEGFFITKINNYEAIGAGEDFALAALYLGASAEKAVEASCELSVYCEKPINSFCVDLAGVK